MNRKSFFFIAIVLTAGAFAAVVLSLVLSWASTRNSFRQLNAVNVPVLERAAQTHLDLSQARTELYRYIQHYEPTPFRIQRHLDDIQKNLEWLDRQEVPERSKEMARRLLDGIGRCLSIQTQLEQQMNKDDSVRVALSTEAALAEFAALSAISARLRDTITEHILRENDKIESLLLRTYAILAGLSLLIVLMLAAGLLLYNRSLQKQVQASTTGLQNSLHQLRQSEARFRELSDLLPQTVFEADAQGRLTYANAAAFRAFGYTEKDFESGLKALDMIHPEEHDKAAKNIARILAGEYTPMEEYTALRKDGTTFSALIYSSSIRRDTQTVGFRGIILDITERKQAEEKARRATERRQREAEVVAAVAMSDHLIQGAVAELARELTEAAARALEVERAGVWLFDKEATELANVDSYVLSTEEHSSGAVFMAREYRNEFDALKEAKYVAADDPLTDPRTAGYVEGYLKPNRTTAMLCAVIRQKGRHLGTLCFEQMGGPHHWEADEISFACQLADQVAFAISNREYRRMHEEKSRLEEDYRQAQKLESIGRLAGGVAHDLNNLLTPILGYAEMLREETMEDDPARGSLSEIVDAGTRARNLVRQLLAFSRKQVLEYKRSDLNRIVAGVERLLRRTIPEDIRIQIIPSSTALPVTVDAGQIEQVLINLAVNAADAMADGGTLTIETAAVHLDETYAEARNGAKPGAYALLAVSDTGLGMDEETRARIFEPFFSTKGECGTGLGLATVYGIVKQHGGNIWVYSEPGEGTTFKVYLALTKSGVTRPEGPTGRTAAATLSGSETILLVEDNDQVRALSLAILRRQGYSVITAENGQEALAILDRRDKLVHLLLTDVVMPEMSGSELFAKAIERDPRLKVLFMSGYSDNVIAHRGVLDQGVAFIQKPFTVKSLTAKVREVLDR